MRMLNKLLPIGLIVLAACSGDEATPTTALPTTVVTTTAPATTTTNTTTAPSTTRAITQPGDPTGALDSFVAQMDILIDVPGSPIKLSGEGTYVKGSFACSSTADFAGLSFTTSGVSTPDGVWIDAGQGQGMVETTAEEAEASGLLDSCPAAPVFWSDTVELAQATDAVKERTAEVRNGVQVERIDLTPIIGQLGTLGAFGAENLEGLTINEFVVWVSPDGWIAGYKMDALADATFLEGFGGQAAGQDPVPFVVTIGISQPNDPDLEVLAPV